MIAMVEKKVQEVEVKIKVVKKLKNCVTESISAGVKVNIYDIS